MSGGETPTGRVGSGRGGTPGRVAAMGAMGGKPAEGAECVCVCEAQKPGRATKKASDEVSFTE